MKVSASGLCFLVVLVAVSYIGCLLVVSPALLLLPISLSIYRRWTDYFLALWFYLSPALLELVFRIRVRVCGDLNKVRGPCVIILNHRTRFDWLFFWSYMVRMCTPMKHRIVLKDALKRVPGFGWGMQACQFIFITRNWSNDKKIISDNLGYFCNRGYPLQLLFFPEGTDLSESNKRKSHQFSEKNGLQKFDYVLHPRTKGFVHCLQELRKGATPPSIVNVTVGYLGNMPQNESDILAGHWPTEIHFCAEIIPPTEIPQGEGELGDWLKQCWYQKEEVLKRFYEEKKFRSPYLDETGICRIHCSLAAVLVFWSIFLAAFFYVFFTNPFMWWLMPGLSLCYVAISNMGPGLDWVVLRFHQLTYHAKLFK